MKQLDQLERYTTPQRDATATDDGELGELSEKFYQAAVQVCVCVRVCVFKNLREWGRKKIHVLKNWLS